MIHELDLRKALVGRPDHKVLDLLLDAEAVLRCMDSSLKERCEEADKIRHHVEETVGEIHWDCQAYEEPEDCAICDERHAGPGGNFEDGRGRFPE